MWFSDFSDGFTCVIWRHVTSWHGIMWRPGATSWRHLTSLCKNIDKEGMTCSRQIPLYSNYRTCHLIVENITCRVLVLTYRMAWPCALSEETAQPTVYHRLSQLSGLIKMVLQGYLKSKCQMLRFSQLLNQHGTTWVVTSTTQGVNCFWEYVYVVLNMSGSPKMQISKGYHGYHILDRTDFTQSTKVSFRVLKIQVNI